MDSLHVTALLEPRRCSWSPVESGSATGSRWGFGCLLVVCWMLVAGGCATDRSSSADPSSPDSTTPTRWDRTPSERRSYTDESYTDDTGRTVEISRSVMRILPLAPNLTEMVYAAGAGEKLVAVTTADDYPPAVDSLPRVSTLPVDYEAITAHEPDLVVATTQVNAPRAAETFESLDIPVYFFSFPTVSHIFEGIRRMGALAGTPDAAADSATALEAAFERIRSRTSTTQRPRVLVLAGSDVLYSFGAESYIHTVIDAAGGESITQTLDASAPTLSEEYVLEARPDVIVGAFGTDAPAQMLLEHHPSFDILPAIRDERIYSLPASLLFRPGPRIVEGTRRLAEQLHPRLLQPETTPPLQTSRSLAPTTSGPTFRQSPGVPLPTRGGSKGLY
jgi:iron complex transport system substrate-binding protein